MRVGDDDFRSGEGQARCSGKALRRGRGFADEEIDALGVVGGDVAGLAVAGPDHAQSVPLKAIADRAVDGVQARKVLDGDAIGLVGDSGIEPIVELGDLEIIGFADIDTGRETRTMPTVAGESAGGGPRDRNARIGARRGPGLAGLHLVALTAHCTPAELRKSSVRMVGKAAMIAVPLAPTASIASTGPTRTLFVSGRLRGLHRARRPGGGTGLARGWHRWMAVWPSFGTRI